MRVIGGLWKGTPHLHPLPGGGRGELPLPFFQPIAGFDRNIFIIQKASSRLIVVGHASTPDTLHTGVRCAGKRGPAIKRAQSALEEVETRSRHHWISWLRTSESLTLGISACIQLIIRILDDSSRIERRKSLRFRTGADRMVLENAHFKALINNDLQIASSSWHPVCSYLRRNK